MREELVVLEKVNVNFGSRRVLEDVNLTIYRDDYLGVIGPNGGGKTTLLKVMLGLVRPASGKVEVFGCAPGKGASRVGYVPQASGAVMDFPASVMDVTLMGRVGKTRKFGYYAEEDLLAAEDALGKVGMLDKRTRQIGRLSGGEQQRVFIARALASGPELLLLDEPTASVDPTMQVDFYELLKELGSKMAVVLVSHDVGVISTHLKKIACVNRRIFYHGEKGVSPEELETLYQCPVDMIAHEHPHRIVKSRGKKEE